MRKVSSLNWFSVVNSSNWNIHTPLYPSKFCNLTLISGAIWVTTVMLSTYLSSGASKPMGIRL